jgi:hypothetical protein
LPKPNWTEYSPSAEISDAHLALRVVLYSDALAFFIVAIMPAASLGAAADMLVKGFRNLRLVVLVLPVNLVLVPIWAEVLPRSLPSPPR